LDLFAAPFFGLPGKTVAEESVEGTELAEPVSRASENSPSKAASSICSTASDRSLRVIESCGIAVTSSSAAGVAAESVCIPEKQNKAQPHCFRKAYDETCVLSVPHLAGTCEYVVDIETGAWRNSID
jgi:hypothetical protein